MTLRKSLGVTRSSRISMARKARRGVGFLRLPNIHVMVLLVVCKRQCVRKKDTPLRRAQRKCEPRFRRNFGSKGPKICSKKCCEASQDVWVAWIVRPVLVLRSRRD